MLICVLLCRNLYFRLKKTFGTKRHVREREIIYLVSKTDQQEKTRGGKRLAGIDRSGLLLLFHHRDSLLRTYEFTLTANEFISPPTHIQHTQTLSERAFLEQVRDCAHDHVQ